MVRRNSQVSQSRTREELNFNVEKINVYLELNKKYTHNPSLLPSLDFT